MFVGILHRVRKREDLPEFVDRIGRDRTPSFARRAPVDNRRAGYQPALRLREGFFQDCDSFVYVFFR